MYRLIILSLLFLSESQTLLAQTNTPNILLIIADDMGIDVTNGYQENERMPNTPTLDSLMENGLSFSNTWSAPQCTPTRAAIMSGKYGIKTGVMRPPGNLDLNHNSIFTTLNEQTNNIYSGAVIGKWHISNPVDYDHPSQHGIEHYEGLFTSSVDDYYSWDKVEDGAVLLEDEYVTTNLTNNAINWIEDQESPWFLWLAHVAPHSPYHVPPVGLYSQENTSDNLGKYLAAIEAMDYEIGRLLTNMDEDTKDNTIIIFVGDNGTPGGVIQNYPQNHSKGSLYEGGIRVPLIFSGKGVSRLNEIDDNLNQVADLHATIAEIAGINVKGGFNNSMSLKSLLTCATDLNRSFIYTDYEDGNILGWAIRNKDYKLIEDELGRIEYYKISEDILEENNLIGSLTTEEELLLESMQKEVEAIRNSWSCNDGIINGDEVNIDDCNDECSDDNFTSTNNIGCCAEPNQPSVYYEYIEANKRGIYTNNFPNHSYCYNSANQMPSQTYHNFRIDLEPSLSNGITKVVRENGRPARYFGVAKNGVIFAPAPAQPFIFENPITGEFNWDWVFEPTNNQGSGQDLVGLDCASAHTGGQGYHYHGNMFEYVDNEIADISSTFDIPMSPLHIGWASDGFPVLYRFGPDSDGNMKELKSSYQLKSGLRQGDGITAPCGAYSGKYTNDYEYVCGKGDLDECNGIQGYVNIIGANGMQTFDYYYVITSTFPQIPRCLTGNVSLDFENGNDPLTGMDLDNDGFLGSFDCDDNNPDINPSAEEILGNDIDENCDGITTATFNDEFEKILISPNPSNGNFSISNINSKAEVLITNSNGVIMHKSIQNTDFNISSLPKGMFIIKLTNKMGVSIYKKHIVK